MKLLTVGLGLVLASTAEAIRVGRSSHLRDYDDWNDAYYWNWIAPTYETKKKTREEESTNTRYYYDYISGKLFD